jgi:hypothetical protein
MSREESYAPLDATGQVPADRLGNAEPAGAVVAHTGDTTDAHDATAVSFAPVGGIAATDVQAAIEELDTEKSGTAHTHAYAPDTADYLVGTAQGGLSAEIVVGATPGGELGGTWAAPTVDSVHSGSAHHDPVTVGTGLDVTGQLVELDLSEVAAGGELGGFMDAPTVDATHSGSTHAATQAAAEATAAGALTVHEAAADPHTGYVREADANWTDLTDLGVTSLHSHAGGGNPIDAWPIGSVFIAVVSTSPATLLGGGTWSAFGTGRVLVGLDSGDTDFDTVEETGGAKTVASSAQTFAGNALGTHQHAAISAGTPAGTNAAEAAHTHTYTEVPNHVHVQNAPSSASGGAILLQLDTNASGSAAAGISTANPTGGVATGTTAAGTSHGHVFTGNALATHQHDAITAGTPAGTNTPGAATSVVQPYIVVYMWKRTA